MLVWIQPIDTSYPLRGKKPFISGEQLFTASQTYPIRGNAPVMDPGSRTEHKNMRIIRPLMMIWVLCLSSVKHRKLELKHRVIYGYRFVNIMK